MSQPTLAETDVTARARAHLSARPFFAKLPAEEQEIQTAALARRIALTESPIGRMAAVVATSIGLLADAFESFLAHYPTRESAVAAGRAALATAGLRDPLTEEFAGSHYGDTPQEFRALLRILELMFPALEHCDPVEELTPEPRKDARKS